MNDMITNNSLVQSHLKFRLVIGVLGLGLPLILLFWGFGIMGWSVLDTISDYYSLRTRDAFVGILFIIGWFLFSYRGYEPLDNNLGHAACIFAMGVAFFPNTGSSWESSIHFISAILLFLALACFSMFLFTKTKTSPKGFKGTLRSFVTTFLFTRVKESPRSITEKLAAFRLGGSEPSSPRTYQKRIRDKFYIYSGLAIILCLILIGIYYAFLQDTGIANCKPVFILESLMIWAFGIAWFIKAETLFRDKKEKKA